MCIRDRSMIEYYGEYIGHGRCKTAFELNCRGARFHGHVLKVAKAKDQEPSIFMKAAHFGVTTSILYDCDGLDVESERGFHCWITERTIPLDQFCQHDDVIKSRCSLAAFRCMLRAAQHGLYLSDCHFFNFGVHLTETATEHRVVIIHAGSMGIHHDVQWNHKKINTAVMHKFWKACADQSAACAEIQHMWRHSTIEECLEKANQAWADWPILTKQPESTCAIRHAMLAKDSFRQIVVSHSLHRRPSLNYIASTMSGTDMTRSATEQP